MPVPRDTSPIATRLGAVPTGVAAPPMFAAQAQPIVIISAKRFPFLSRSAANIVVASDSQTTVMTVFEITELIKAPDSRNMNRKACGRPRANRDVRKFSATRRLKPVVSRAALRPNVPIANHMTQYVGDETPRLTVKAPISTPMASAAMVVTARGRPPDPPRHGKGQHPQPTEERAVIGGIRRVHTREGPQPSQ